MIYVFWKYLKNWFSREMLIFMDLLQVDGTHSDPERDAGGQRFEDVLREEVRIREMLNGPAEGHDAVLIKEIHKVKAAALDLYFEYCGNECKVKHQPMQECITKAMNSRSHQLGKCFH
jgi:hypothetical protein